MSKCKKIIIILVSIPSVIALLLGSFVLARFWCGSIERELFSDVYNGHTIKVVQRGFKDLVSIYHLKLVVDEIEQCELKLNLYDTLENRQQRKNNAWVFPLEYITAIKHDGYYELRFGCPDEEKQVPRVLCMKDFSEYMTNGFMHDVDRINKNIEVYPNWIGFKRGNY